MTLVTYGSRAARSGAALAIVLLALLIATPAEARPKTPAAPAVVLYDQYDNDGNNAIISTSQQGVDRGKAADDFVVPAGQSWAISQIDFRGNPDPVGEPTGFTFSVFFYANAGSLPGSEVASRGIPALDSSADFAIPLDPPVVLSAGTYWVSVQANVFSSFAGFYWEVRSVQSNSPAAWQQVGHGTCPAPAWFNRGTCFPDTASLPDQMFRLHGTVSTPTAVTFSSFRASRTASGVLLRWRTAQESRLLGFNVYRSGVKVNRMLIAARGSGAVGAAYRLRDASARRGATYTYRLQVVSLDGTRAWLGTAVARR